MEVSASKIGWSSLFGCVTSTPFCIFYNWVLVAVNWSEESAWRRDFLCRFKFLPVSGCSFNFWFDWVWECFLMDEETVYFNKLCRQRGHDARGWHFVGLFSWFMAAVWQGLATQGCSREVSAWADLNCPLRLIYFTSSGLLFFGLFDAFGDRILSGLSSWVSFGWLVSGLFWGAELTCKSGLISRNFCWLIFLSFWGLFLTGLFWAVQ